MVKAHGFLLMYYSTGWRWCLLQVMWYLPFLEIFFIVVLQIFVPQVIPSGHRVVIIFCNAITSSEW